MSDLVGNPEDRFSQNKAQLQVMLNDGEFYVSYEDMPAKVKQNYPETLFPLPDTEAADWGSDMWYVPLQNNYDYCTAITTSLHLAYSKKRGNMGLMLR